MSSTTSLFFADRFLEDHVGQIIKDPVTAIIELVANSWDAYATEVHIQWPTDDKPFQITDNGHGMTANELNHRWRTLTYNRREDIGSYTNLPSGGSSGSRRKVFGRNGKGRFASFCFASQFTVETGRDHVTSKFEISRPIGHGVPFSITKTSEKSKDWHGLTIKALSAGRVGVSASAARSNISTRFLTDPNFRVFLDGEEITFEDIPSSAIEEHSVDCGDGNIAELLLIDSERSDRTTKQHGVAWWVNRRLVGQCDWQSLSNTSFLDGRREEAKRYTFIVKADHLEGEVLYDWSGFKPNGERWKRAQKAIEEAIQEKIAELTKEKRIEAKKTWLQSQVSLRKVLPKASQSRLAHAMDNIMQRCPGLSETHVLQVMDVLASMEKADSKYALLDKMSEMSPSDVDDWNGILDKWTFEFARDALNEIETRLRVLEELSIKTSDTSTDEVKELQPLFERNLWIFGPQLESIEFTSNKGMTRVIQQLFNRDDTGSTNRPDFVIRPDSSVGFYSLPKFDHSGEHGGCSVLSIVELKRPGVPLGSEEKQQVWKYVKELIKKGYVTEGTMVYGHVMGDSIEEGEESEELPPDGGSIALRV